MIPLVGRRTLQDSLLGVAGRTAGGTLSLLPLSLSPSLGLSVAFSPYDAIPAGCRYYDDAVPGACCCVVRIANNVDERLVPGFGRAGWLFSLLWTMTKATPLAYAESNQSINQSTTTTTPRVARACVCVGPCADPDFSPVTTRPTHRATARP